MAIYKDMGFEFNKEPQEGTSSVVDEQSINQSIKNILFTMKQEVPFDPLFGSGIRNLLFEKMSPVTEILLKEEIEMALTNHEPRIEINNIEVKASYDYNLYEVEIRYIIVYLNEEVTLTLDLNVQGI